MHMGPGFQLCPVRVQEIKHIPNSTVNKLKKNKIKKNLNQVQNVVLERGDVTWIYKPHYLISNI